jgi:integrase
LKTPKRRRPGEGSVFPRGEILWVKFRGIDGRTHSRSTGLRIGQEADARALLTRTLKEVRSLVARGETGPLTVRAWSSVWLEQRRLRGRQSVDEWGQRLKVHVLPEIGDIPLADIRPEHISRLVDRLRAKRIHRRKDGPTESLAPRTVRNIYFLTHAMFQKAMPEFIAVNPCCLQEDDLPGKVDKDREWRSTAIFSREEIEQLISDSRVPEDRRAFNALLTLAGLRFGEASALCWRHYDPTLRPLGRLVIANSYDSDKKIVKSVKVEEKPREIPVHATLAAILAEWKLNGWCQLMGRQPAADDPIVPSRLGANRNVNHMLKRFHQDLERLGMRRRRQHDLRRTFISLAIADGARKDILKRVSHGPEGDIMDMYTTLPWSAVCAEVAKLNIVRKVCDVEVVASVVGGGEVGSLEWLEPTTATVLATVPKMRSPETTKGRESIQEFATLSSAGWTGLEPAASGVTGRRYNQLNYHPNYSIFSLAVGKSREPGWVDIRAVIVGVNQENGDPGGILTVGQIAPVTPTPRYPLTPRAGRPAIRGCRAGDRFRGSRIQGPLGP